MRADHYQKFVDIAEAMNAVDKENPGSRAMKVLRARVHEALDSHAHLFTDEQFQPLSGGTKE